MFKQALAGEKYAEVPGFEEVCDKVIPEYVEIIEIGVVTIEGTIIWGIVNFMSIPAEKNVTGWIVTTLPELSQLKNCRLNLHWDPEKLGTATFDGKVITKAPVLGTEVSKLNFKVSSPILDVLIGKKLKLEIVVLETPGDVNNWLALIVA